MSRLAQINARIKAKLRELDDDRADRERAAKLVASLDARAEDIAAELTRARQRLNRRREALAEVRQDLEDANAATPDADTDEEAELAARRDELAGEIEEAVALRDRLLSRLDRLQDKQDAAKAALKKVLDESAEDREALARLRERRKRAQEQAAQNDRPSPNFTWAEFDCNDGTPLPQQSKPAVRHWCQTVGELVRARYGSVHINSAFRHRAYNARIGGEDNSVHIYDFPGREFKAVAVDFSCAKGSPPEWYSFTSGKADGRGLYATFHHADTRNRIGWPDATWRG